MPRKNAFAVLLIILLIIGFVIGFVVIRLKYDHIAEKERVTNLEQQKENVDLKFNKLSERLGKLERRQLPSVEIMIDDCDPSIDPYSGHFDSCTDYLSFGTFLDYLSSQFEMYTSVETIEVEPEAQELEMILMKLKD